MKDLDSQEISEQVLDLVIRFASNYKTLGLLAISTATLETISRYIQTYIYADWRYLGFLFTAMAVDILSKFYQIIDTKSVFSIKELFSKMLKKIIKYSVIIILSHVLSEYTVLGEKNNFFSWVPEMFMAIPLILETESALANLGYELSGKWADVVETIKGIFKPKNTK